MIKKSRSSTCTKQIVQESLKFFTKHYGVSSGLLLQPKMHLSKQTYYWKKKDTIILDPFLICSSSSKSLRKSINNFKKKDYKKLLSLLTYSLCSEDFKRITNLKQGYDTLIQSKKEESYPFLGRYLKNFHPEGV